MKSKIFPIVAVMMICSTIILAQQNNNKIRYFGSIQTGLLAGSSDIGFTAQTLHGIKVKNWIGAVGAGYDGYGVAGIPLVFHAQRNFTKLKHQPFVYAQSGIQFSLKTNEWNQKLPDGNDMYDLKNGFIAEVGGGYLLKLNKRLSLVFSTAFSYKHIKVTEQQLWGFIDFRIFPPEPTYNKLDYYYRRISCKAGLIF